VGRLARTEREHDVATTVEPASGGAPRVSRTGRAGRAVLRDEWSPHRTASFIGPGGPAHETTARPEDL
jgi:hypothetical protein